MANAKKTTRRKGDNSAVTPLEFLGHGATGVHMTEKGLSFDADITQDRWMLTGLALAQADKSLGWALADWLEYGYEHFGDFMQEAIARTGLSQGRLVNVLSTGKAFPPEKRIAGLSFGHHTELKAIADSPKLPEIAKGLLESKASTAAARVIAKATKAEMKGQLSEAQRKAAEEKRAAREDLAAREDAAAVLKYLPHVPRGTLQDWRGIAKGLHSAVAGLLVRIAEQERAELAELERKAEALKAKQAESEEQEPSLPLS